MPSTPEANAPLPFHRTAMLPLSLAGAAVVLALVSTFLVALVAKLVLLGLAVAFVLACGVSLGILLVRVRKADSRHNRD